MAASNGASGPKVKAILRYATQDSAENHGVSLTIIGDQAAQARNPASISARTSGSARFRPIKTIRLSGAESAGHGP